MKRKWMACVIAMAMLLSGLPGMQAQAATTFTDIEGNWAQEEIERATELGLFAGVSETEFNPDGTLTRAMFVVVLAKYDGYDPDAYTASTFQDVPKSSWYASAVEWAAENGVVAGTSATTFAPNQIITREQICVMLVNYANYAGTVLPRTRAGVLFADSGKCADYALDAVYTLYRSGVVSGVGNNKFNPTGSATRAECAVILCNYIDAIAAEYTQEEKITLINHRGYNTLAPENTLEAYELAIQMGYTCVETDVRFTADDVPVLLHDATIDRTSTGSGNVEDYTYEELLAFDFNAGMEDYEGTKLPTLEEFLTLCEENGLQPYIEMKGPFTKAQIKQLLDMVEAHGMTDEVVWAGFEQSDLETVAAYCETATLDLLVRKPSTTEIENAASLQNGVNTVYLGAPYTKMTAALRAACLRAGVTLCVWTVDDLTAAVEQANTCAQSITTDSITAEQLYP